MLACIFSVYSISSGRTQPKRINNALFQLILGLHADWGRAVLENLSRPKEANSQARQASNRNSCIFQNPMAKCADCLFFAGMILLLISMKVAFLQGYIQFILCCLVLFSFHMHCILNGNVYRYILLETGRERK